MTTSPANPNARGIVTMLCAVALLSLMDAGLKLLAPHYPALQVAALRALASWPLALIWVIATTGLGALLRVRWPLHLLRGALGVAMMGTFIYGLRTLPLTSALTIFFVAPLLITALSVPLLGERVGPARWLAILAGFGGVLIALRPSGEGTLSWAGVAILGCARATRRRRSPCACSHAPTARRAWCSGCSRSWAWARARWRGRTGWRCSLHIGDWSRQLA